MASVVSSILAGGGGQLLDGLAKVIDAIKGKNPEDAAALAALTEKYQQDVIDTQTQLAAAKINENIQLNATAGENIQADAKSGDRFTQRARPSVIWMGNVFVLWNWAIVPVFGHHWGLVPATIPDAFWWTWGTVVTGYVFSRTAQEVMAMPGDSKIQLPFGLSMGQNSKGGN